MVSVEIKKAEIMENSQQFFIEVSVYTHHFGRLDNKTVETRDIDGSMVSGVFPARFATTSNLCLLISELICHL
jgi:hypothetical protein